MSKLENEPIIINENAHSKIMKDMSKYLDECKNSKKNCQCTCMLEYNSKEINENNKWKFIYQCNENIKKNNIVKNITLHFINDVGNIKIETYQISD